MTWYGGVLYAIGGVAVVYGWGKSGAWWMVYFIGNDRIWHLFWIVALGAMSAGLAGRAQYEWYDQRRWTVRVALYALVMLLCTWWYATLVRDFMAVY